MTWTQQGNCGEVRWIMKRAFPLTSDPDSAKGLLIGRVWRTGHHSLRGEIVADYGAGTMQEQLWDEEVVDLGRVDGPPLSDARLDAEKELVEKMIDLLVRTHEIESKKAM